MKSLFRLSGFAALVASATFAIGLVMFVTMFMDLATATEPSETVAFLVDHQLPLYVWNLIITIVFGIALVPLVLGLSDRLGDGAPVLTRVATVFGFIWSGLIIAAGMITNIGYAAITELAETNPDMAENLSVSVDVVTNGLGGGNEVVGGVWVLLLSIAALRTRVFSRWLGWLGAVMGVAGIITVIPPLEDVGAVFGVGLVVWFAAVGLDLLRVAASTADPRPSITVAR